MVEEGSGGRRAGRKKKERGGRRRKRRERREKEMVRGRKSERSGVEGDETRRYEEALSVLSYTNGR